MNKRLFFGQQGRLNSCYVKKSSKFHEKAYDITQGEFSIRLLLLTIVVVPLHCTDAMALLFYNILFIFCCF